MAAEGQYVSGYGRVLFAGAGAFGPSHRAVEKLKEPSRDRLLKVVFCTQVSPDRDLQLGQSSIGSDRSNKEAGDAGANAQA
jgi:hypothetical protein